MPPPGGEAGFVPPPGGDGGVIVGPGDPNNPGGGEGCVDTPENPCDVAAGAPVGDGVAGAPVGDGGADVPPPPIEEFAPPPDNSPQPPAGPGPQSFSLVVLTTQSEADSNLIPVKNSAGLKYLVNNPDVMVYAQKTVRARGITPGRDFQRAMEQVAIDHYNNFGRIEGRQLDGGTSTRSLIVQPKFNEPLIKVSDSDALKYLVNNPDVMVHAQKIVRARGIAPGRDFQRAMEQVAIDHYNNFGRIEGRTSPRR